MKPFEPLSFFGLRHFLLLLGLLFVAADAHGQVPTAPTGVTASYTALSADRVGVLIQWTDTSSNETNFEIWTNTADNYNQSVLLDTLTANTTRLQISNSLSFLPSGGSRYFWVVPFNASGRNHTTPVASVTNNGSTTNNPPSGLSITVPSTNTIRLAWTDNSAVEEFTEIWARDTGAAGNISQLLFKVPFNITQQDAFYFLQPGRTYEVTLRTSRRVGNYTDNNIAFTAFSTPVSITMTGTDTPLNPPSNLSVAAFVDTANGNANSFRVSFDDNSTDETSFVFQEKVQGADDSTFVTILVEDGVSGVGQGRELSFSGYNANDAQEFRVIATRGNGPFAAVASTATSGARFASFDAPTDLRLFTGANNTRVQLFWSDNATTETGYEFEYRFGESGTFNYYGTLNSASLSRFQDQGGIGGFSPSALLQFRIRAVGSSAASAYSNIATILATPTNLTATSAGSDRVNLSWTDNSGVEGGYAVYFKKRTDLSYALFRYEGAGTTSTQVSGLVPNTAYDFQVAAVHAAPAESARSNAAGATTGNGFTSSTYAVIPINQAYSYQAVVSTGSARTSWSITGLPTGLTFNSGTGIVSGTPTVSGDFLCPMTASFANGSTANSSFTLRVVRPPVVASAIGSQSLIVGGNSSLPLATRFSDPDAQSAARIVTNIGTMDFILFNTATPQTVTNFMSYVNAPVNNFNGAVFHRSEQGFVVQGGAFKVDSAPNNFTATPTTASPPNEPGLSNLRGTVAMAKLGNDPNSATNQFFVNLAENTFLNASNGGFTVFGRVAGNGMAVADAMAQLPRVFSRVNVGGGPVDFLTSWPVTSGSVMDTTKMVTMTSVASVPVLSYSITGNTNPAAVTASISGTNLVINGLALGQSDITVTATDLDGGTISQTVPVVVANAPVITSSPPTSTGTVGIAYSFTCTASGTPAPTFAVASGALPTGLTLSSAGVISGSPSAAGTFTGTITASNTGGTSTAQNFSIIIAKGAATITLGSLAQTYNGSARSATATTSPAGLNVSFTYNGSATAPTNAGSYTIVATINDANYTGTQNGTLVVSQATATITLGSLAQTFNNSPRVATATTSPAGLNVSFTYNGSSTAPTNAGSYTVVATINDTNYTGTQNGTLVISPATATITLGSLAQTYSGGARVATATTSPAGLSVSFTYDGSATAPTNAGSYAVVGTINDTNYTGTQNGTLVVSQATATITLGSLAQAYDGNPRAASATTSPAGLNVTFTYNGSATAPTNHGSYAVVATISDANHTGTANGTLVISGQTVASWRAQQFTPTQISNGQAADTADPDLDGWKNFAEYALGTNPNSPTPPLAYILDGNGLSLVFTRPKALPNVTYAGESTVDFSLWSSITLEVIADGPIQTVRVRDTLGSGDTTRRFLRLVFGVSP